MQVINFGHPLSAEQLEAVSKLVDGPLSAVHNISVQLAHDQPMGPQIRSLIERVEMTSTGWQQTPFVVCLPGLAVAAALVLAEIHGRAGHFPSCIRLRPEGANPPKFVVAELLHLHAVRESARETR